MKELKEKYIKDTFMMLLWWHLFIYLVGILMGFLLLETNLYWITFVISFIIGSLSVSASKFLAKEIFD